MFDIKTTGKYHGLNSQVLTMPCPNCGEKINVKGSDIKNNRTVCCRHCTIKIQLEDKDNSFAKLDKKLEEAFKNILR